MAGALPKAPKSLHKRDFNGKDARDIFCIFDNAVNLDEFIVVISNVYVKLKFEQEKEMVGQIGFETFCWTV